MDAVEDLQRPKVDATRAFPVALIRVVDIVRVAKQRKPRVLPKSQDQTLQHKDVGRKEMRAEKQSRHDARKDIGENMLDGMSICPVS